MLGRGESKKWLVYNLAQEDKSPNSLSCDDAQLPAAQDALRKELISSLAELATSLLPIRETDPFTADVITASGACCAGTNRHGLSGAGGGPGEPRCKHLWTAMVWSVAAS